MADRIISDVLTKPDAALEMTLRPGLFSDFTGQPMVKERLEITVAAAKQRGDLERVKLHLQEILRLDRHHDQANRMLAEARKALQEQQRSAQIVQMRSQAQVALAGQQYEEALGCAEPYIMMIVFSC